MVDHKVIEPEDKCCQSRTIDTDSSERDPTVTNNGSLQLTELHTARE